MEAIQEAFTGICREIFNQHYPDPVYEQLRWVILLGALFAFLLPWLCDYRLGEKVPCLFLIEILHYYFRGIGIVPVLFLFSAYIVALFYLLLKFDRKFVPRNRETMEPEERQE